MYVVTVTFEIESDHIPQFLPLVRSRAQTSLNQEPGCRRFDVCVADDESSVFLYEVYADQAAFETHLESSHFRAFDAAVAPLIAGKLVKRFRLLD